MFSRNQLRNQYFRRVDGDIDIFVESILTRDCSVVYNRMSDIDEEELGERWKKFKKENWARTSYSNKFTECEKMTDFVIQIVTVP